MSSNESNHSFFPISQRFEKIEKILTSNTTVFEPCNGKIDWEWSWRKLKNVKFALHLTKKGQWKIRPLSSIANQEQVIETQDLKIIRKRIEEIKALIEGLSKDVAKKKDLKKTEKLLIKNQETLQSMLKENMEDLQKTLGRDIEKKIGKRKAKKFWDLLEKIATISDIVDFVKHVRDLSDFLEKYKIVQIALPFVLKMILG